MNPLFQEKVGLLAQNKFLQKLLFFFILALIQNGWYLWNYSKNENLVKKNDRRVTLKFEEYSIKHKMTNTYFIK